jgi:hypothetical protein
MDHRITKLLKRLAFLGYCSFEIKNILQEITGQDGFEAISFSKSADVIKHLEMYEQLGQNYLQAYSK